jgi:hypothetical protein
MSWLVYHSLDDDVFLRPFESEYAEHSILVVQYQVFCPISAGV